VIGRQPWVFEGAAVSSLSAGNVLTTLVGFVVFYSTLLVVDIYRMTKAIRLGPTSVESDSSPDRSPIAALAAAE
jgi:cytochrome bd ubiquinol oxidase subunit I